MERPSRNEGNTLLKGAFRPLEATTREATESSRNNLLEDRAPPTGL